MTLEQALAYFLSTPSERPTDKRAALVAALQEAAVRRKEGPEATAALVRAAHTELRMSYRDIEAASRTDRAGGVFISQATAQRIDTRDN